jgi:hypothetical protein
MMGISEASWSQSVGGRHLFPGDGGGVVKKSTRDLFDSFILLTWEIDEQVARLGLKELLKSRNESRNVLTQERGDQDLGM